MWVFEISFKCFEKKEEDNNSLANKFCVSKMGEEGGGGQVDLMEKIC